MARTSRWLVGSSSRSTSQSPMSNRARSTRRRWPPERVPTVAFQSTSSSSPAIMARTRGSPAHSYSGISPTTARLHGVRVAQIVALAEYAHRHAAGADDAALVHFHIARKHPQKRGFPIAVLAHDADASPLVHPEDSPRTPSSWGIPRSLFHNREETPPRPPFTLETAPNLRIAGPVRLSHLAPPPSREARFASQFDTPSIINHGSFQRLHPLNETSTEALREQNGLEMTKHRPG